ncbi:MAG: hypothetical protein NVS2B8_13850 [Vulcanimicrobiaceae bacterium]
MHRLFTIQAPIEPSKVDRLDRYLETMHATLTADAPVFPFAQLTKIHFASFFILPDHPVRRYGSYLVFESNIDGTIEAYIEQLCSVAAGPLHAIFSTCADYTATAFDRGYMRAYLRDRVRLPSAAFVGNVGRDVGRIHAEHGLRGDIERWLDGWRANRRLPSTAPALYRTILERVTAEAAWSRERKGRLAYADLIRRRLVAALILWLVLAMLPVALPLIALFVVVLLAHEVADVSDVEPPTADHMRSVTQREDNILQNHFASIVDVKPGAFRRFTIRLVLFLVDRAASLALDGTLSRLDNIHFAHWVLIDRGRRLLFVTNYDGSWENYLDDFIDKAAVGLTAIWSNTTLPGVDRNFPKTRLLVTGGARDERKFKNIARASQVRSIVWYSAYRDLSVPRINANSAIRDGIARPPVGAGIDAWLKRF